MTDNEDQFAQEAEHLRQMHYLSDLAEELAGVDGAPTLLFSAALCALNRLHDIEFAMGMARVWAESLEKQSSEREQMH